MTRPYEKYDAVKVVGIDRLLCVLDVVPDYQAQGWIVFAEDVETQQKMQFRSVLCKFVCIGQLELFEKNEE